MVRAVSAVCVLVPADRWVRLFRPLASAAMSAARACELEPPGATIAAGRYHLLASRIELLAADALVDEGATAIRVTFDLEDERRASSPWPHTWIDPQTAIDHWPSWVAGREAQQAAYDALRDGCGVVLLVDPESVSAAGPGVGTPPPAAALDLEISKEFGGRSAAFAAKVDDHLGRVLAGSEPLRPNGIRNDVLADGLRFLATSRPVGRRDVPVAYADGSVAEPFPCGIALVDPIGWQLPDGWVEVDLTLLSQRHVDHDVQVVGALLSNQRVSSVRPLAAADARATAEATRFMTDLLAHAEQSGHDGVTIVLHHSGFQPAVVGAYRALVGLIDDGAPLAILPSHLARVNGDETNERRLPWATQ